MVFCISNVIQKYILEKIRIFKFFYLIIDEFTDISSTNHVVVFDIFVEEDFLVSVFLDLFEVSNDLIKLMVVVSWLVTW